MGSKCRPQHFSFRCCTCSSASIWSSTDKKCESGCTWSSLTCFSYQSYLHWSQYPTSFPLLCIHYSVLSAVFSDLPSSAKCHFPKETSMINLFKIIEFFPAHHSYASKVYFIQNIYCNRNVVICIYSVFLFSVCALKDVSCNKAWTLPGYLLLYLLCLVLFLVYNKCSVWMTEWEACILYCGKDVSQN